MYNPSFCVKLTKFLKQLYFYFFAFCEVSGLELSVGEL